MAIDIGTNSTLHLVADIVNGELEIVERGIVGNKLGLGLRLSNKLDSDIIEDNRTSLKALLIKAKQLQCDRFGAVGTHALRISENRHEFVRMTDSLGLVLTIISPKTEAMLAWTGLFGNKGVSRKTAMLDIGGGSSELSIGNGLKPEWTSSVPVAAVNISTNFFHHDPPLQSEIDGAIEHIDMSFTSWIGVVHMDTQLFGVAGAITSLAAIETCVTEYFPGAIEGEVLNTLLIESWSLKLMGMSMEERRIIPGMPIARAGNIHAGVLILSRLLNILPFEQLTVSEKGVLFGLAYSLVENKRIAQ